MLLPVPLLLLLLESLPYTLAQQQISLEQVISQTLQPNDSAIQFVIPPQSQQQDGPLNLVLTLCSSQPPLPRFIVNNGSMSAFPTLANVGQGQTFEVNLDNGFGSFEGSFVNGGTVQVFTGNIPSGVTLPPWSFQLSLAAPSRSPHLPVPSLPLLGDTTSNQVLIMSPPFSPYTPTKGTFPNFHLPPANFTQPTPPGFSAPNYTVLLFPTSGQPVFTKSACGLLEDFATAPSYNLSQLVANSTLVTRGEEGFRTQWIIEGNLTPQTNYTAYILQDGARVSDPVYLSTKSSSFNCPLAHSLPYCPRVAHTIPLLPPSNSAPGFVYDSSSIPGSISSPLLGSLGNFSKTLLIHPCGRAESDFSPLKGCDDCWDAYRNWVCAVSFPRCSDPAPPPPPLPTSSRGPKPSPTPTPAFLVQSTSSPRSPILPPLAQEQTVILPCHELCTATVRSCPPMLQFSCPLVEVNANRSYGIGFVDGVFGSKVVPGRGSVGGLESGAGAVDRWGGVWCTGL